MNEIKIRWLIYTVLVGMIPFFCRILIVMFYSNSNMSFLFNANDFIMFGLVLHITNINTLEHYDIKDKNWKIIQTGTSILFIIIYTIFLTFSFIEANNPIVINTMTLKIASLILSLVSFFLSYSIYGRILILMKIKEIK